MTTILINDANPPVAGGKYDLVGNTQADSVTVANTAALSSNLSFYTYAGADTFDFSGATGAYSAVIFAGSGDDVLTGGSGVEWLYDGAGSDTCHLGAGNDILYAGAGNDTYDGGAGTKDTISFYYAVENTSKGDPTGTINTAGVTVSLSKTTAQTTVFGTDIIKGFEGITAGNGADKLTGSSAANELSGQGGNDTIYGLGGKDLLRAGAGRDILVGGAGADEINLSGDLAPSLDKVRYLAAGDSTTTAFDSIYFFSGGGTSTSDRIDLSALLGSAQLAYRATSALTAGAGGQVRWQLVNDTVNGGKDLAIFIDTDTDSAAEMKIIVDGPSSGLSHLVKGDFIL